MNRKIKKIVFILIIIMLVFILTMSIIVNITNQSKNIEKVDVSEPNISKGELNLTEEMTLRVLVVEYNPKLKTQGNKKASEYVGFKNNERTIISEVLSDLTYASHGYVKTQIVDWIDVDEFAPLKQEISLKNGTRSNHIDEESWLEMMKDGYYNRNNQPITQQIGGFNFNYDELLQRFDLVQRRKNNEFDWVFIDLIDPAEAYESIMVGNNTYWINGNDNKTADCKNFPIIFANIARKDGILHSIGHMAENVLNNVYGVSTSVYKYYDEKAINITSQEQYDKLNLWQKFVLSNWNSNTTFNGKEHYGPGTVHCPPNATYGYDYSGTLSVYSNWRDWQDNYPNLTGQVELTNATAWLSQNTPSGDNSDDRRFMRWWFSLMPHYDGRDEQGYYHNWWKYITTLDNRG